MHKRRRLLFLLLVAFTALVVRAQDATPAPLPAPLIEPLSAPAADDDIAISFPPPVYLIRGAIDIVGTVAIDDLASYRVEFRPLELPDPAADDATQTVEDEDPAQAPWFPATLPGTTAIQEGVIGTWNTSTARDGLYEIRLVVTGTDDTQQFFRVSPLRVENDAPEFLLDDAPEDDANVDADRPDLPPTPTQLAGFVRPTLAPTPTALNTGQPTVTALADANVRRGDDTAYDRVDAVFEGEQAVVIGISSFGSGWYYIETARGRRGFIAPSTVRFSGNAASLTLIDPPPPPTPPATATPVTRANLQVTGLSLDPFPPNCGEAFNISINVANTGTGPTSASGSLRVVDRHLRTASEQGTTLGGFPIIQPGQSFVVVAALTINTFFEEGHEIVVELDHLGQIAETNEGDNRSTLTYTLQQATCG